MTQPDRVARATETEPVDISLVIPTKNEAEGIATCLRAAQEAFDEMGLRGEIIVSDSSTDRTPEIAAEMGARVVHPDRPGYGYAYSYGFQYATGDVIVIGDGDTTYDFREMPKLVEELDTGADIVLGNRFAGDIRPKAMPPLHQYVGNPLLTTFLNVFYDIGVSDAHSGFRVISRDCLEELDLRSDGMEFASEMLMQARAKGFTVTEVPITYHERAGEATLDSFTDGWRHVKFMLKNAPNDLFAVPGLSLILFGAVLMSMVLFNVEPLGQQFNINSLVAGCLSVLVGWQLVGLSVFSAYAAEAIKSRGRVSGWVVTHFSLERGLTLGAVLFLLGSAIAGFQLAQWATSGFTRLPTTTYSIFAMTTIVLGFQTVFQSFFTSILIDAQDT
jgi:glycosyltransferase involved in cell wall biosynthesis